MSSKRNTRKSLGGWRILAAMGVLALIGWGVQRTWFARPPAPQVITAKVEVASIEDNVLASGRIEADKEVSVGAQVSGQIQRLRVKLGESVKQGQLIAEIDSTPQQNALRNAEAQVALLSAQERAKQAALHQADLAHQRQRALVAQDAGSKADFESAQATLATLQAEIAALDAQIRQAHIAMDTAKVNLGYTRITAPINGVVVAVVAEEGQTVNANQATPTIIKLAKLDTVRIKAQISEADVVRVKTGMPVYFTILGEPAQRYKATLSAVEPAPESEQTDTASKTATTTSSTATAVYYNGLFDVPNPDGKLRIAMTAQVFVVLAKADNALVIPATALSGGRGGKGATVKVLEGPPGQQAVATRQVRIGMNNRVQAQVLEGLKAGELVVVGDADEGAGSGGGKRRGAGMF